MASWLVSLTPDQAVQVQVLAGDIVLCSWTRHLALSASFHPGVQMGTSKLNAGVTMQWTSIPSRG